MPPTNKTDERYPTNPAANAALAAVNTIGSIRRPLAVVAATLVAHQETVEITPIQALGTQAVLAAQFVRSGIRNTRASFKAGLESGQRRAEAARARTVVIPKADLAENNNRDQLRKDLGTLARHERLAIDLNARMHPEEIGRRFDKTHASKGPNTILDLVALGIKPTPGIKRALTDYAKGGREELVSAGLLGPRAGEHAAPQPTARKEYLGPPAKPANVRLDGVLTTEPATSPDGSIGLSVRESAGWKKTANVVLDPEAAGMPATTAAALARQQPGSRIGVAGRWHRDNGSWTLAATFATSEAIAASYAVAGETAPPMLRIAPRPARTRQSDDLGM